MAKTTRLRVFFDANVLYSALHSPSGAPAEAVSLHAKGRIVMVASSFVLTEVFRTVHRKLPQRLTDLRRLLTASPPEVVRNPTLHELRALGGLVNPKDAPIIAAAAAAKVDCLVTGDRRLIAQLKSVQPSFAVLTPRGLFDEIKQ